MAGSNLTLQLDKGDYIVAVTASDAKAETKATFAVTVTAKDANDDGSGDEHSGYYADAYGKTGASLKASLHHIIKQQRVLSYSQVWDALKQTDEDPANPDNVILLYSGESRAKNASGGQVGDWNREHVWAKSHGNFGTSKGPGTDLHHLRPTDVQVNSARGNKDFDNGGSDVKGCDGCKMTNVSWEPPNRVKGDVARMIFYMAVRYEAEDKVDLELNEILGNGSAPYMGKLSTLLEWNEQDPVDDVEMHRNDVIEELQGNRNPFIDHPEWADAIWEQEATAANGYDVAS
ncbi:endonuclease I family protein [Tigheibacillus jepli]|uniref:endonuclease I family protein n=1 Tax=Tigheibacillus jepli TaxID=3035914 RepID=UPI00387E1209